MARNKPRGSRAALGNDNQPGIHRWLPIPARRFGYRFAYVALRTWWFVRRPKVSGVKCVLTDGSSVLLVRHTYGPRGWDLPGGSIKHGESADHTARREMKEELGVAIDDWRLIGRFSLQIAHREDQLHVFHAELSGQAIALDFGELETAQWFDLNDLPSDSSRYVRPILARMPAPLR
jgi:8-oxo-dGTP pyrophosphatase MutT (NUDIX family)